MITNEKGFYDLLKYGFGNESYQEFVDTYLHDLHTGRKTAGFDFDDDIQIDFTYAQIRAELGLDTIPSFVDIDSPGVYKHQEGFELSTGSIPRAKHGFAINEKRLREEMIFAQRTGRFSENMPQKMRDITFDNTAKLINGNYNALTLQRDQMVSKGAFSLDAGINPFGLKGVTFSASVPDKNKIKLAGTKRWFTDANNTEGADSNPIKDLQDQVNALEEKGLVDFHFEVDRLTFKRTLLHSKVRTAIALSIYPLADPANIASLAAVLDETVMKAKLEGLIGASIEVVNNIVSIESPYDKAKGTVESKQVRSFEANVWVLVPNGKLGTIKAVEPIAVPDPAARLALYDGGRTILKQWYKTDTNTQYIESELTALVVPDKPQYMLYLTIA